jgi:hypothetical protein
MVQVSLYVYEAVHVNLPNLERTILGRSSTCSTMSDRIPSEIWFYIAEFIPDEAIYRQLRRISSLFFHLAMDIEYREVYIRWNAVFHTLPRIMTRLRY